MMTKMLKQGGFTCKSAQHGREAVDLVEGRILKKEREYDVILMDFMMPVTNGPEAMKEIRALGYKGVMLGTNMKQTNVC